MPTAHTATHRIAIATLVLAVGLLLVGWIDYRATRRDLLGLLVEQAVSLRHSVAAAARAADAAAAQAQASLSARLLDNARLLDRLDRAGALDQATLDDVSRQHRLFRVTVFSAAGARQLTAGRGGPPAGAGRGFGLGPGGGQGAGAPGWAGAGALAERLLRGTEPEAVSEVHGNRWGRGWRMAAGVRRMSGGAIVLNVDAADLAELGQQATLDHVLGDIVAGAPEVAYVILVDGDALSVHGRLGAEAAAGPAPQDAALLDLSATHGLAGLTTSERDVGGKPVLEFAGPVNPAVSGGPLLRLGLSLDSLRGAERRSLTRLVLSLLAALGLGAIAIAFVALRREHGALRARHALAEQALRRRDRLAAMGELASTVAHEVRNPLNAIGMSVQRLRREFVETPGPGHDEAAAGEQRELLDVLSSETSRINRIVQQFLDFARPPRLVRVPVDLAAFLAEAAAAVRALADARTVAIEVDVGAAHETAADPDQLKQAVGNLLRNAIEASPPGSTIVLRATGAEGGGHRIEVEDAGPGIPAEDVSKIFDLYFTRKPGGSGIGLAVTHQIVDAHGGTIEVDTEPGRGTRMIVVLPPGEEA